jgi:DNA-binding MarR family transcriptional regulator
MRLIPFLSTAGIRPTDLAALVDVSKQAMGQSLAELEARGFVEYVDDPSDGRARLVRLSKGGIKASKYGLSVLARLEKDLSGRVGRKAVGETLAGLQRILPVLEEWRRAKIPASSASPRRNSR